MSSLLDGGEEAEAQPVEVQKAQKTGAGNIRAGRGEGWAGPGSKQESLKRFNWESLDQTCRIQVIPAGVGAVGRGRGSNQSADG